VLDIDGEHRRRHLLHLHRALSIPGDGAKVRKAAENAAYRLGLPPPRTPDACPLRDRRGRRDRPRARPARRLARYRNDHAPDGCHPKSLGAIHPTDRPTPHGTPPSVVVKRLDTVKKWAAAMVLAEAARELEEFADRLERLDRGRNRGTGMVDAGLVVSTLRERADGLRTGVVTS
jgi:hypothetical protein